MIIIPVAGLHRFGIPLIGNQRAGEFHPDVDTGRSGISLQGLPVETAGNQIVLENEIVGPLRHLTRHDLLLLRLRATG